MIKKRIRVALLFLLVLVGVLLFSGLVIGGPVDGGLVPIDGGTDPVPIASCGDGTCASTEDCGTCPSDCVCSDPDPSDPDEPLTEHDAFECFVAGTQILMADGSLKPIEDVMTGDEVLGQSGADVVGELYHYILGDQPLYSFNDGEPFVTKPHPFMTTEGWKAIDVEAAKIWNPHLEMTTLQVGDVIITKGGHVLIESITPHDFPPDTPIYNFAVQKNKTYYADGFLVHNKDITCWTPCSCAVESVQTTTAAASCSSAGLYLTRQDCAESSGCRGDFDCGATQACVGASMGCFGTYIAGKIDWDGDALSWSADQFYTEYYTNKADYDARKDDPEKVWTIHANKDVESASYACNDCWEAGNAAYEVSGTRWNKYVCTKPAICLFGATMSWEYEFIAGSTYDYESCTTISTSATCTATSGCSWSSDTCGTCVDKTRYYYDGDGDGYGNATSSVWALVQPAGYVINNGDCDDSAVSVHPSAQEFCDAIDRDCNGDPITYADRSAEMIEVPSPKGGGLPVLAYPNVAVTDASDCSQYGECAGAYKTCTAPAVWSACSILPTTEVCDGLDNDCDISTPDGADECTAGESCDGSSCVALINCYKDDDRDGYGAGSVLVRANSCSPGEVTNNLDCDDEPACAYSGSGCGSPPDASCVDSCYGFSVAECTAASQCDVVNNAADGPLRYPTNTEVCDGIDNDCVGGIDSFSESCGSGVCAGTRTCTAGSWGACSTAGDDAGVCASCSSTGSIVADLTQDGDCAATTCPTSSCGAGSCGTNIYGSYPASVANTCTGVGSCTSNSCSVTCQSDIDGDGYSITCGDCAPSESTASPVGDESSYCEDGLDNDCDGLIDHEDDSECPIPLTISSAVGDVCPGGSFSVSCTTTQHVKDTMSTQLDVGGDITGCSWDSWSGTDVIFTCTAPATAGAYNVSCISTYAYTDNTGSFYDASYVTVPSAPASCPAVCASGTSLTTGQTATCSGGSYSCSGGTTTSCGTTPTTNNANLVYTTGSCNNPCNSGTPDACGTCSPTASDVTGCQAGHIDLNNDYTDGCEYACTVSNGGTEICDGLDNDCDGVVDNGLTAPSQSCGTDVGECVAGIEYQTCNGASGWSGTYSGCTAIGPTTEVCDASNLDEDCDGGADNLDPESPGISGCTNYYNDLDNDGYGNATDSLCLCDPWITYDIPSTATEFDCNDNDASINPSATESCNGVDDDCDRLVDEFVGTCSQSAPECTGTIVCSGYDAASCPLSVCSLQTSPGRCLLTRNYCYNNDDCVHYELGNPCEGNSTVCGGGIVSCTGLLTQIDCVDSLLLGACSWNEDTCDNYDYDFFIGNPSEGCSGTNGVADGCAWTCDYAPENKCGDDTDNDGVNSIDCFDQACQASNAANTITTANIENYNCLGTTYNGTHETGIANDGTNYTSDYYCGEINATESGVGEPVGLCCPSGEAPAYDAGFGTWSCLPSNPCLTPSGDCDYEYTSTTFLNWRTDGTDCLNPSDPDYDGSSSACCAVISAGDGDYYSDSENIKIY